MAYIKQTWLNDPSTPLNATRMSFIEQGIADAHTIASAGGTQNKWIFLDSFTGTDDQKLTSAISAQQSTANMPPIVLGARRHDFNQTRNIYSGLKIMGQSFGAKNTEQSQNYVTSWVKLGSAIGNATSSWWVTPGGNIFDVYMGDFAVEGNGSNQQFIDVASGTLYASEFRSLAANYLYGMFGSNNRSFLMTQVYFTGHWTVNNIVGTNFWLGGSDNSLWMAGYVNMGPGGATSLYKDPANGIVYELVFSGLSNTNVGYIYMTALNGYRGLRITNNCRGLHLFGGVYEGYKATGTINSGPAPGTCIRIESGNGSLNGVDVGQGMANPVSGENALIHMTGGEWAINSPAFHRGGMAETVPCIYHGGGRLLVQGATRSQTETWGNRPRFQTTATPRAGTGPAAVPPTVPIYDPNSGTSSFYCPDMSMISV